MAALDFPSSPTTGDQYVGDNGAIYVFDTNRWKLFTPQVNLAETVMVEVFTASGTWVKPSGLIYAEIDVVGGGGGGGGGSSVNGSVGSGGGSGGYARATILASDLGATETVTVGAGGTGGSFGNGSVGGTTTFTRTTGDNLVANGGEVGAGRTSPSSVSNGGAGGTATGGDINIEGRTALSVPGLGSTGNVGGKGADGFLGSGGLGAAASAGGAGAGFGAGGGGGRRTGGGVNGAGGAGAAGVVIVTSHIAAPRAAAGLLVTGGVGQSVLFTANTTDATQTDMTYAGDGNFVIPAQTAVGFEAYITARDTGSDDAKAWTVKGLIARDNANNTAIVGSVVKEIIAEDSGASDWDVTIEADDTSELLEIKVTGEAATTISWRATMMFNSDNGNLSVGVTNTDDIGVLQIVEGTPHTTYGTTTATFNFDDTIPQNTEGTDTIGGVTLPSVTITPKSEFSRLVIEASVPISVDNAGSATYGIAVFQDSTADAIAAMAGAGEQSLVENVILRHEMVSGTTSATTFSLRVGSNGTIAVNGTAIARLFGGVMATRIRVTEYLADNQILSNTILQTGALVQEIEATPHTAYGSTSANVAFDNSIPQNTEGANSIGGVTLPTLTITPTNANNRLVIESSYEGQTSVAAAMTLALYQDDIASAIAVGSTGTAAGFQTQVIMNHEMVAGTTDPITFSTRVAANAGTLYVHGSSSNRIYGGISAMRLRVREIKA